MIRQASKLTLAAAAALALPTTAQAGTETTTSTASFNVVQQCAVTGATVNIGTYIAGQTWLDLGKETGYGPSGVPFVPGTRGKQWANFGSILCTPGTYFTIRLSGNVNGCITFIMNNKTYYLSAWANKIGTVTVPDGVPSVYPGGGKNMGSMTFGTNGTGVAQPILGSVILQESAGSRFSDPLLAGQYVDPLTYTLTF